tara:strand:+ start:52455 stop:53441 length:987 start_codon:yes stop_codon:yes gene_type:complete
MNNDIEGNVLITGGTGSWGMVLTKRLLENNKIRKIIIVSRNEHKQVEMKRHFNSKKIIFKIGDVRDFQIMVNLTKGIDILFHLAALKHVPVCEENSWESVQTNVLGTHNVIQACIENKVKVMVDVSTDKAVEPHNIYGITKACAEKLVVNSFHNYQSSTRFVCIRGGNVVGTNGSVIPLFKKQLEEQNFLTLTNPKMTRYLMKTNDAINLIFNAIEVSKGGEIFVMRMKSTSIEYLADSMIKIFGNSKSFKKILGRRPGEKIHEVLVSKNENHLTYEINPNLYVIVPEIIAETYKYPSSWKKMKSEEFTSNNAEKLDEDDIKLLLTND